MTTTLYPWRRLARRVARVLALPVVLGGAASGCVDDTLTQLSPDIDLCPRDGAAAAECATAIAVGEVPAGAEHEVDVFVTNRGDGRLVVDGATVELEAVTVAAAPDTVGAGNHAPLTLRFLLPADALGDARTRLHVKSNDADEPDAVVELAWTAIPPPAPRIVLCDGDSEEAVCSPTLDVDFGGVRPTQAASRAVFVKNEGDDPLHVETIGLTGSREMTIESSTQGGTLAPGGSAPVVIVYAPGGPGPDEASLTVTSDDPRTPVATATLRGSAADNLPPTASALESVSGATSTSVRVDELVGVLGGGSTDPEGDPLTWSWSLAGPPESAAVLADPTAENALFSPDVAGTYTVTLVVADSLGQESAPVEVVVEATPRYAFRARLSWPGGGDLDLHLVESGSAAFSSRDCRFDNRIVAAGDPTSTLDDALLIDDATTGPGSESAVIEAPVAGTWEVWVHVFDDAGLGPVTATLEVVKDDDGTPVLTLTRSLAATCDLWHAADVTLPAVTAVDANATTTARCL